MDIRKILRFILPGIATLLIFFDRTKLWSWNFKIPLIYKGDALLTLMSIKAMLDEGWFLVNHSLSAPEIFYYHDYPQTSDSFHYLVMKIMGFFWHDPSVILNFYFLIRFPLTAIISTWALLEIGISYWVAVAVSIAYAFIPCNMFRGVAHLFIGTYYILPILVLITHNIMSGKLAFDFKNRRLIFASIVCVILAGSGVYYAFFGCAFLALASVVVFFGSEDRPFKKSLTGIWLLFCTTFTTVLLALPIVLYHRRYGKNFLVGHRAFWENEHFGLKIVQLLLPIRNHFFEIFRKKAILYQEGAPLVTENLLASLGTLASLGFLALIFWSFFCSRDGKQLRKLKRVFGLGVEDSVILSNMSLLNLFSVLLATIGGFGTILALLFLPAIRAYNRISILIAYLCLVAVAVFIDRLIQKHLKKKYHKFAIPFLCVLAYGAVLDQTGYLGVTPPSTVTEFKNDEEFVKQIASQVPQGAMIFQLPYVSFPEVPPVEKMDEYEHLKMYLHSRNGLRWSYPAMRGRPAASWQQEMTSLPLINFLYRIQDKGFKGVYIDRLGYSDRGKSIEKDLKRMLLSRPIYSEDQRRIFFPLEMNASIEYSSEGKLPVSITIRDLSLPFYLPHGFNQEKFMKKLHGLHSEGPVKVTLNREDGVFEFERIENMRADGPLPESAFKSQFLCPKVVKVEPDAKEVAFDIQVKNLSPQWWPNLTSSGSEVYLMRVRSHLYDQNMKLKQADFSSIFTFAEPVGPGETYPKHVTIKASDIPVGVSHLEYDLVQEGYRWATSLSGKSCVIQIEK